MKTTDGGQTWIKLPQVGTNSDRILESISIVGNNNIWISGSPKVVYNSTDGGTNWTIFDSTLFQNQMQGIDAINDQIVYTVGQNFTGSRGFISRTANGGTTWDSLVLADNYNKVGWIGVTASNPDNVVIYGGKSHYTHTIDGGSTWQNDSVPDVVGGDGPADINHLIMLGNNTWWGAFDLNHIVITNDNGNMWTKQNYTGPNMFLVGIDAFDYNNALVVGESTGGEFYGRIIKTDNAGSTWENVFSCNSNLKKVSYAKY